MQMSNAQIDLASKEKLRKLRDQLEDVLRVLRPQSISGASGAAFFFHACLELVDKLRSMPLDVPLSPDLQPPGVTTEPRNIDQKETNTEEWHPESAMKPDSGESEDSPPKNQAAADSGDLRSVWERDIIGGVALYHCPVVPTTVQQVPFPQRFWRALTS